MKPEIIKMWQGNQIVRYYVHYILKLPLQEEVHRYLRVTHSALEIDFYNFDWYVHVYNFFYPERKLIEIPDLSYDKENVPVSCVNR